MPGYDFPNSPTAGQQVTGAGNQVYTFDGQKWAASGGGLNQATADARYVNVSGDTMAGSLVLAADPTASLQAATRHYVDNAINLAGNYLGTWSVAANTPSISAGGSIANANYVAVTANPAVAETAPVGIPGIAGQSINNGDRIIWASGLSVWQILRNASVTLAAADARYVALAGSTMSGALVLAADPVADLQATTRQYVDQEIASHVGGGVTAIYYACRSTTTAAVDPGSGHVGFNTAAQGTATELYISGMSSQSVDWSLYWRGISAGTRLVIQRQTDSTIVCRFTLNSTAVDHGGWLTLSVTPYGTPAGFPQANNAALIVAIVTVGGNQFVATDGTIAMTGPLTLSGNPTANLHAATKQYVDGAAVATAQTNVGRNLIHNATFTVAQRGAGPWTVLAAYTSDRWFQNGSLDAVSYTVSVLTDTDRAQIGDEAAGLCLQNVFTGNAGASAFSWVQQKIESVRRLSGKTVTLSFWAKAATGTPKLGLNLYQDFGTGGSPSAGAFVQATGAAVTLSTTWARYTTTFTVPSTAGKTLGSNANDLTGVVIAYSSGATNNAVYGNIGVQSGTISIWGVQLEIGSVATPLEKRDPGQELRQCERFYQIGFHSWYGYGAASGQIGGAGSFRTQMRATATMALVSPVYGNASGATVTYNDGRNFTLTATATALGAASLSTSWTASADL